MLSKMFLSVRRLPVLITFFTLVFLQGSGLSHGFCCNRIPRLNRVTSLSAVSKRKGNDGGKTKPTINLTKEVTELENALRSKGCEVPEGAVQGLLDGKQWIYNSERVDDILEKLDDEGKLYTLFDAKHHLQSSAQLFQFVTKKKKKTMSVVYGHKNQGKSQFLFFVFKVLQAVGEKVLYLDNTISPFKKDKINITKDTFCGQYWRDKFQFDDDVKTALNNFYEDRNPDSFADFIVALLEYTQRTKERIWIIIDEVASLKEIPIQLPSDQDIGPFHWIVTGSAGIGSWVSKRHLENYVFDLPLFSKKESYEFTKRLSKCLRINLKKSISGVPPGGIADWLEEQFGGVIGYITEMLLEIAEGGSVSRYMSKLEARIDELIRRQQLTTEETLAKEWLRRMEIGPNQWGSLRDAGLCGSTPPRGVIFAMILKWLFSHAPQEDELKTVTNFRKMFSGDSGLDGYLLELEEVLKLKARKSIHASKITFHDDRWIVKESTLLPSSNAGLNIFNYNELFPSLQALSSFFFSNSSWYLIQVPSGFDVIDVVLVDMSDTPTIYGIQKTRSKAPFSKHATFDTCSENSQKRLQMLWTVIAKHFQRKLSDFKFFYVMLAPNCPSKKVQPPKKHRTDFYFAPPRIQGADKSPTKERTMTSLAKFPLSPEMEASKSTKRTREKT